MNDYIETTLQSKNVYHGAIFDVESHDVRLPNGNISKRDIIKHHGAVCILATKDNKVLLVRQYRKAIEQSLFEVPAGKLDSPKEEPLSAAKRELEEETNYQARHWKEVYTFVVSPGYCTEKITLFEATELIEVENPLSLDEDEFLDIVWIEIPKALEMVEDGTIIDAKTIMALQYLALQ
ncbi:NUDIX domain-containing protein [Granulicatella sp. zg-ZJ]|uniref:NUDIX hydrolase n=1 Tax=Granulicatella sp. zg-ZJ TaxID=2678504 RepID=UPI0013D617F1|nr:NUDIX hydrolase [Granulicatella sp. zg-ZJ]NEW62840.1 NUDIX domain-containing protein [Granulicatella sp. zg-ZJ]